MRNFEVEIEMPCGDIATVEGQIGPETRATRTDPGEGGEIVVDAVTLWDNVLEHAERVRAAVQ